MNMIFGDGWFKPDREKMYKKGLPNWAALFLLNLLTGRLANQLSSSPIVSGCDHLAHVRDHETVLLQMLREHYRP